MPNIIQYTNEEKLQPNNAGYEAREMEGRHIDAAYGQMAQDVRQLGGAAKQAIDIYQEHATQQQIQTSLATKVQTRAGVLATMNQMEEADINAPTHDPHLQDKIVAMASERYSAMDSSFSTDQGKQWWAREKADELGFIQEHALAAGANAAGIQSAVDSKRFYSATAYNVSSNPSTLPMALRDIDTDTANRISSLGADGTPENIAAVKERAEAAKSAAVRAAVYANIHQAAPGQEQAAADMIMGARWKNADGTTSQATDYLGEEGNQQIAQEVRATHEQNLRDQTQNQDLAIKQEKEQGNAALGQLIAAGTNTGPGGSWLPPANFNKQVTALVQRYPNAFTPEQIKTFSDYGAEANKQAADGDWVTSNPQTYQGFRQRLSIPPGQPGALSSTEIYQAVVDKQLSVKDADEMAKASDAMIKDPSLKELHERTTEFLLPYKVNLGAAGPNATAAGIQQFYQLQVAVDNSIKWRLAKGDISASQLEEQMLDPKSPTYLGKYISITGRGVVNHPTTAAGTATLAGQSISQARGSVKWDGKESATDLLKRGGY